MPGFWPQIALTCSAFALAPLSQLGCSSSEGGTLQIVTGEETDTFTQAPVPATLTVSSIDSSGTATQVATATLPASTVDLGSFDPTAAGIIEVSGYAAAADAGADAGGAVGEKVLSGQSIVILFGDLAGSTLPIFVQRTGEMARLPNPPSDSRASPVLGVIEGRYVVVAGGGGAEPVVSLSDGDAAESGASLSDGDAESSATPDGDAAESGASPSDGGAESSTTADGGSVDNTTMVYDLGSFTQVSPAITLPIVPTSMAFIGFVGWLVNDAGVYQYDFSSGTPTSVTLPTGASYADIAGGATVSAPDGSQYIVGATRAAGPPTQAVLALDSSGNPSWLTLAYARAGAAATWVPSVGLVIVGGSSSSTVPGAEVIAVASSSMGSSYAYPADPSLGAGATALDGTHVLVAGGTLPNGSSAGVRVIDLSCTSACAPVPWAPLGTLITGVHTFAITATSAVVVGSEPSSSATPGLTHVYEVTSSQTTELPTKIAHTLAGAIASPIGVVGSVLLFGGAPAIESLGL